MTKNKTAVLLLLLIGGLAALRAWPHPAGNEDVLGDRIHEIRSRPEYKHSNFGVEVYSLDENRVIYELHGQQLFTPASTTKLLTEGTALELLGADYRFHTRVYRTAPILPDGILKGDLILVASGDPNLSGRIRPDGTLAFENHDHSYAGSPDTKAVPGDPLLVIRELAAQIAAHGVKRLEGRVLVDATLFPEGERELGTDVVISPVVVNDNVVDLTVSAGAKEGAPAAVAISPATLYVNFVNKMTTGPAGSKPELPDSPADVANPDGSHTVTLTGKFPLGHAPILYTYAVPQPSRFAQVALVDALREKGIQVEVPSLSEKVDFKALSASYTQENVVAEHVSPPLSEEVKVTLKVSQNLHASMMPFILGAVLGHKPGESDRSGFDLEHDFLSKAGLDLTAASQADGAGGAQSAFYTPDFMVHYLAFMAQQKDFPLFEKALPILGRDGTLWNIDVNSPAAGHVFAKTGTFGSYNALNKNLMLNGKGLAGYMTTADGRHLAFAIYANHVPLPLDDPEAAQKVAGQALGQIASLIYSSASERAAFDVIIRNGHIVDGSGSPWYAADIAIRGDRIAAIGRLDGAHVKKEIDASGQIVSPGFIDMLGQSELSLLIDNRSLSKLSQGITSEITGEGGSAAPQSEKTLAEAKPFLDQYHLTIDWTTLAGYFQRLERDGTPLNLGTYVGAAQVREAVLGDENREPTPAELQQMEALVEQAMKHGALGVSTALIYPPGHFAKTEELIALAKVAARYGGIYATHMRSEGATEMQALDEAIRIGREAGLPVEIFHLKVSGKPRWGSMTRVVAKIQAARDAGLDIRADQYPYIAGATALASELPPWVAEGGLTKLLERLHDPKMRARIKQEMAVDHEDWENLYYDCGGGSGVMISGVVSPALKKYDGQRVSEMAKAEGKPELDALFDFILADKAQTGAIYFMANEKDLVYALKQPWTAIGLDSNELSLDGPLFEPHTHPRGFGSVPRFLGHYVRDEKLMPLEEAIRKITSMPAQREHLDDRGLIKRGFHADITVFDPVKLIDRATFTEPTRLSEGVNYVFVNGQLEYDHGTLTGAKAGRALRGPGWKSDEH